MDSNTGPHMVNQAMYLYFLDISAQMAEIIGESEYADALRSRLVQAVDSFNRLYVDPQTGFTLNATPGANLVSGRTLQDSQASYATPLALDLFSDEMTVQAGENAGLTYKEFATKRLRELIEDPGQSNNGNGPLAGSGLFSGGQASNKPYTITTGFNATPNILPALTKNGEIDTAYKLFSSDEYTSWLYPVTLGATSMWELWNSYERGFAQGGQSSMNSQNHFALGASQQWMYEYQLGITSDGGKGYREFVLQPVPGGDFTSLEGGFHSSYGVIKSAWTATGGVLDTYAATVPANTTATLYLPVVEDVSEFDDIPGVTFEGMGERNGLTVAKFSLGAGGYEFTVDGADVVASIQDGYVVEVEEFVNTGAPEISGDAEVGSTLNATAGTWSAEPSSVSYQWLRGGHPIAGAVSDTYVVTAEDAGQDLSVVVTAERPGHEPVAASSATVSIPEEAAPSPNPTTTVTATATATATATVTASPKPGRDLYETPGFHQSSGRNWMTVCEEYSSKVDRCWTYIWGTTVHEADGRFTPINGWQFNNLTYIGGSRADWASNPLGHTGRWTAEDGRQWRTECDTDNTGRNGCRSYNVASLIERDGDTYRWVTKEVFNNQVRFG